MMELEQVMIIRPKIEPRAFDPEAHVCKYCDDPDTCGTTGKYLTDPDHYRIHERFEVYFAQFVHQLLMQQGALMMNGYRPNQVLVPLCAPVTLHLTLHGSEIIRSGEVRTPTLQRSETYNHG